MHHSPGCVGSYYTYEACSSPLSTAYRRRFHTVAFWDPSVAGRIMQRRKINRRFPMTIAERGKCGWSTWRRINSLPSVSIPAPHVAYDGVVAAATASVGLAVDDNERSAISHTSGAATNYGAPKQLPHIFPFPQLSLPVAFLRSSRRTGLYSSSFAKMVEKNIITPKQSKVKEK